MTYKAQAESLEAKIDVIKLAFQETLLSISEEVESRTVMRIPISKMCWCADSRASEVHLS